MKKKTIWLTTIIFPKNPCADLYVNGCRVTQNDSELESWADLNDWLDVPAYIDQLPPLPLSTVRRRVTKAANDALDVDVKEGK